jgi:prophage tail gpP-like protein
MCACVVVLGMTQTEVEALTNGTELLGVYSDNDMETWRDLLSWVAQSVACFATMDRSGQLILKQYNQTVVDTIDDVHRLEGSSFADYITRYTGMSIVNISDQTTTYYSVETDDALTMNLGSNPLLQYGLDATKKAQREAILNAIQQINYVPFENFNTSPKS